jgi:MFS family permease
MENQGIDSLPKTGGYFDLNRNIKTYLLTGLLINISFGVFQTDFNLYILSLGLTPDFLGLVLSMTPFAQALAAIPIGFLAEKIGYKRSLILVNLVVGSAYLLRVISSSPLLIMIASFLAGVMACGYFIIQLPFISHYAGEKRNSAYTINSIVFYTSMSIGGMLGGFLPDILSQVTANESIAFRIILVAFSLLIIMGTIPLFFLDKDQPDKDQKISLSPYISGIDANTIKFAVIEIFIGSGLAFLLFFMNLLFINHYQSNLESFGVMSALLIIPLVGLLLIGPRLADRFGNIPVILFSRILSVGFAFMVGFTVNPILGGAAYMFFRSTISLAQTLWFGFAITVVTRRSRMATSAWLEITFQLGLGIAAIVGGKLVATNAYPTLGYISSASMLAAFILTLVFFGKCRNKENQPTN